MTDTVKDVSNDTTRSITENSINNNKALENLNERVLDFRIDE